MNIRPAFRTLLFFTTALLFCRTDAISQSPFFENIPFTYRNTALKPQRLLKDREGWLYFGTDQGLFRYDGIVFRKMEGLDSLVKENVTALFQGSNGKIWVGFQSGLIASCSGIKLEVFNPEEGLPKVPVTAFAESSDGLIWFSTNGEGIYCIENRKLYNFNADDGLNDNYVHALLSIKGTSKMIAA